MIDCWIPPLSIFNGILGLCNTFAFWAGEKSTGTEATLTHVAHSIKHELIAILTLGLLAYE